VLRRYAFVAAVFAYMLLLSALHARGLFPRPGAYDLSQLVGSSLLTVEGIVSSGPAFRWNQTRFVLEGAARPLSAFHGRIVVTLPGTWEDLSPGDVIRVRGWPTRPRPAKTTAVFDEESYWAGQRVYTFLRAWSVNSWELVRPAGAWNAHARAWHFHEAFRRFWQDALPAEDASILLGMTLGARGTLEPALKEACIRAGVYHIVVVSGQNMGLLISLSVALLGGLRVPRRWCLWVCAGPVLFYTLVVGSDPPVTRAACMALVGLGVLAFRRDVPRVYPLAWAAAWILLREPEALFGASFQLSFGATASLLWFWPARAARGRFKPLRWFLQTALVAVIVYLGIWPLLAWYFHRISLMGFMANWSVFPLSSLVMAAGLLMGIWGVAAPQSVPAWGLHAVELLVRLTLFCIRLMARCPGAVVAIPRLPGWIAAVYYTILFGILWMFHRRKKHAETLQSISTRWHRLQP
jgi:ComEC/Rec2-related protein